MLISHLFNKPAMCMTSLVSSFLFSCLLAYTPFLSATTDPKAEYVTYVNQDGCYTVQFPSTWKIETPEGGEDDDISAISPAQHKDDKAFENVEIWVETLENPMPGEEYFALSLKNMEKHSVAFEIKEKGTRMIDGVKAHWFHAFVKKTGASGEVLQYQMIVDDRIYILNFTAEASAYAGFEKIFETIVSSFRFKCD